MIKKKMTVLVLLMMIYIKKIKYLLKKIKEK